MKSVFASKTVWFNVITVVVLVISLPQVADLMGPAGLRYALALSAVGNVILRVFFTSTAVSVGDPT